MEQLKKQTMILYSRAVRSQPVPLNLTNQLNQFVKHSYGGLSRLLLTMAPFSVVDRNGDSDEDCVILCFDVLPPKHDEYRFKVRSKCATQSNAASNLNCDLRFYGERKDEQKTLSFWFLFVTTISPAYRFIGVEVSSQYASPAKNKEVTMCSVEKCSRMIII